ncbi:MAG: hypothetical protein KGO05_12815, partial [Chloroflexota bacterium]|nr:hypothetical protein [Chloroflexota bacterium]
MRYLRAHLTLRYGLSAAIVNAALLGVEQAIRALNPAIIPSPQGRHMSAIVMLSCVALVTLTIGYLTTRDTGRVTAAQWAGALAVGLPTTGLVIISYFASGLPADNKSLDAYAFIAIVLILAGALAGFLVAALGGLAGRIRYRQAHREQIAERAAARARRPTRRMRARAIAFQALMAAALVAVTMAPIGLTNLANDYLSQWQGLVASAVALLAGFGLLRFADRADWRGYLYDFFGAILIVSGLIVGIAEITNYALSLLAILGPIIFMWRGVRRSIDRALGVRAPTVNDPPEIAPVTFRHDGESIVVYPRRRTLALHAAAFVGATLVCGAMAVGFRSAGPVLVLGLGAFILVFLLFCVI